MYQVQFYHITISGESRLYEGWLQWVHKTLLATCGCWELERLSIVATVLWHCQ